MSSNSRGFTLIEIMVALVILAGLALLTATAIKNGVENRNMLSADISREAQLADALRLIRDDVGNAFHYRDQLVTMQNEILKPPAEGAPPEILSTATPRPTPAIVTGFYGEAESIYFTTLNNTRVLKDARESDQAKVGYWLDSCKSRGKKKTSGQCLYRGSSPYLDEKVNEVENGVLLVENVVEFKLRYLGPEREEYVETWKTGAEGDAISKDKFPYAVEVTLTIHNRNDPRDRAATQSILAPIRFPNNPPKKKTKPGQGNDAGSGAPPI
jgi:prepilin-type N-terminal cleavage/methylation domain-containing protein